MENIEPEFIKVKECNVRYIAKGSSAPVLLLHGFGEFLEVWWFNIDALSEHYRVYAMDLPGHGLSDRPPVNCTLPLATNFVYDFMQALGIDRAHLIGHSFGGVIGLNMAINFPGSVDRLVLADCGGFTRDAPLFYRLCTLPLVGDILIKPTFKPLLRRGMRRAFYNPDIVTAEMVDLDYKYMKMPGRKQALLDIMRSSVTLKGMRPEMILTDKLNMVKSPTLFIHGEQDALIPLADVQNAYKLVPRARLEVIAECGHCPFLEKPQEFNEVAIDFLDSEGRVKNAG